jgi:hypothetical protein
MAQAGRGFKRITMNVRNVGQRGNIHRRISWMLKRLTRVQTAKGRRISGCVEFHFAL